MMDHLFYELSKEYRQERLREAEKERMLRQFQKAAPNHLREKLLVNLGDILVNSGLKLKSMAQSGA
jgi:hypothetical protein